MKKVDETQKVDETEWMKQAYADENEWMKPENVDETSGWNKKVDETVVDETSLCGWKWVDESGWNSQRWMKNVDEGWNEVDEKKWMN